MGMLIVTSCVLKSVSGTTPAGVFYSDDGDGNCIVCMTTSVNRGCHVINPCKHAGVCKECIDLIRAGTNECPLCRKKITGLGKYFKFTAPEEVENDEAKHNEQHHHGPALNPVEEEESKYDHSAAEDDFYRLNIPWVDRRECWHCLLQNKGNVRCPRSFGRINQRCPCGGRFGTLPAEMELRTYVCPRCKGSGARQNTGGIFGSVLNGIAYLPIIGQAVTERCQYSCRMCHGNATVKRQCKWPERKRWRRLMATLSELC